MKLISQPQRLPLHLSAIGVCQRSTLCVKQGTNFFLGQTATNASAQVGTAATARCCLLAAQPKATHVWCQEPHLKAAANSTLPKAGAPKEMQRTSAVGHCTASQEAARVDTVPAPQNPTLVMRLGGVSPAVHPISRCRPHNCHIYLCCGMIGMSVSKADGSV